MTKTLQYKAIFVYGFIEPGPTKKGSQRNLVALLYLGLTG